MHYTTLLYSLGTGLCMGALYGFIFVRQHALPTAATGSAVVRSGLFGTLRLLSFAAAWYFILKSPFLNSILVLVLFFISFWTVILSVKGRQ